MQPNRTSPRRRGPQHCDHAAGPPYPAPPFELRSRPTYVFLERLRAHVVSELEWLPVWAGATPWTERLIEEIDRRLM